MDSRPLLPSLGPFDYLSARRGARPKKEGDGRIGRQPRSPSRRRSPRRRSRLRRWEGSVGCRFGVERVPEVVAGNTRERGDGGIERHRRPTAETEILVLVQESQSSAGRLVDTERRGTRADGPEPASYQSRTQVDV